MVCACVLLYINIFAHTDCMDILLQKLTAIVGRGIDMRMCYRIIYIPLCVFLARTKYTVLLAMEFGFVFGFVFKLLYAKKPKLAEL